MNTYRITISTPTRKGRTVHYERFVTSESDAGEIRRFFAKQYQGFIVDVSSFENIETVETPKPNKPEFLNKRNTVLKARESLKFIYTPEEKQEKSAAFKQLNDAEKNINKLKNKIISRLKKENPFIYDIDEEDISLIMYEHVLCKNVILKSDVMKCYFDVTEDDE